MPLELQQNQLQQKQQQQQIVIVFCVMMTVNRKMPMNLECHKQTVAAHSPPAYSKYTRRVIVVAVARNRYSQQKKK